MASEPANEPVLGYAPGSAERAELRAEIARQKAHPVFVPLRIAGEQRGQGTLPIRCPQAHALNLGEYATATRADVNRAIETALAARTTWAARDQASRSAIFLRAAERLAGPLRQRLNAATLLGQSKTPHQAEIDSACELVDFLRFNAYFAERIGEERLRHAPGERNQFDFRPLEGFVYAVSPFNFTAIAGNLPSVPALLGNVVVWKPSPHAMLSAHHIFELFREAGLPDGVINLVAGDAQEITDEVLSHRELSGIHFTGSSAVFEGLFQSVGQRIASYRNYPRLIGETGGKNAIIAHESAELDALAVAVVRGGFEFQGQKCSAASRVYVPRSLAPQLEARLKELLAQVKVGDPADFSCFMGAVIARHAYDRITSAIQRARGDGLCRLIWGGGASDSEGFFIEPTVIQVQNPRHPLLTDELFGPVVGLFVYDDDRYEELLANADSTTQYGLTCAVFARDRAAVDLASRALRYTAGNFYVNDKPTGAVVGQQPFGGARHSGTDDKAGAGFHLYRWLSPRVIKENFRPPTDFRYPFLAPEPKP
ncbi:MAG TPA: L-glutamate gamma-semialdehyde dehydrogenase [Polyangiaceae bacterium]|nr:L-glutamate gamma-semialdehyde dehydrogenase [Polyangiaceae bacterium]